MNCNATQLPIRTQRYVYKNLLHRAYPRRKVLRVVTCRIVPIVGYGGISIGR